MVEGSAALWFSASGFELLDVMDDGVELVVAVQTTATGRLRAVRRAGDPEGRRWVTLRDAPSGDPSGAPAMAQADLVVCRCRLLGADVDRTGALGRATPGAPDVGFVAEHAGALVRRVDQQKRANVQLGTHARPAACLQSTCTAMTASQQRVSELSRSYPPNTPREAHVCHASVPGMRPRRHFSTRASTT